MKRSYLGYVKLQFDYLKKMEEELVEECAIRIKECMDINSEYDMKQIIVELVNFNDNEFIKNVLFKLEGVASKEELDEIKNSVNSMKNIF